MMMLFIFAALTLAFLSFEAVAKSTAGFKPSSTVGKSLIKENKINKMLAIRGGANLGPINESNFLKAVAATYIIYAAQLGLVPNFIGDRAYGTKHVPFEYFRFVALWMSSLAALLLRIDALSVIFYSGLALTAAFFFLPNSGFLPGMKKEGGSIFLVETLIAAYLKFA